MHNHLCRISSRFCDYQELLQSVHFSLSYSRHNRLVFFGLYSVQNIIISTTNTKVNSKQQITWLKVKKVSKLTGILKFSLLAVQVWNALRADRWTCRTQKIVKQSPSGHHRTRIFFSYAWFAGHCWQRCLLSDKRSSFNVNSNTHGRPG